MHLYKEALALKETLHAHRVHLHQIPETGFDLLQTTAYVEEKLKELGYAPKRLGGGLVATVGKADGPCFLLRADMDALPVKEEAEVDFASQNGCMHACGHDMHMTALLGAAALLKAHEGELAGTVKLVFQPAEEIMMGAERMIAEGLMETPVPQAALSLHVFTNRDEEVGTIVVPHPHAVWAAVDRFTIEIKGKGCHGAQPHKGIDPLTAAAHLLLALQSINARELDPTDNLVLTIGQLHGGNAANVIPDDCFMSGTIRTMKNSTRSAVKERVEAMTQTVAAAFRAEARVDWESGCPVLEHDADLCAELSACLQTCEGLKVQDLGKEKPVNSMVSEDFSCIAERIPSVLMIVAGGRPTEGYAYPQHHPKAMFHEDALPHMAAAYARCAMEWLKKRGE